MARIHKSPFPKLNRSKSQKTKNQSPNSHTREILTNPKYLNTQARVQSGKASNVPDKKG